MKLKKFTLIILSVIIAAFFTGCYTKIMVPRSDSSYREYPNYDEYNYDEYNEYDEYDYYDERPHTTVNLYGGYGPGYYGYDYYYYSSGSNGCGCFC